MHYTIVSIIILIIIILQFRSYYNTIKKIDLYNHIFPSGEVILFIQNKFVKVEDLNYNTDDETSDQENEHIEVSQLEIKTDSPVLQEITKAINNYLQKNKGAASDFHLIKDIVERYCGAEEEEITTQQPIPLYLGLMGTMVGIIVGIGAIAFSGGLVGDSMLLHISELMLCVAIAMTASLVGVLCTTLTAWKSKDAISKVEASKNQFYSRIQTELLPVLSGDATNAIYLLQQNLLSFNQTFKNNVAGLDNALSKISDSSKEQIELIELIRDIDIKRVAQANISVLKELKDCTKDMAIFNSYLQNVSGYLNAVNALSTNINKHLDRTAVIERMGKFFESEIAQVSAREQYINQVVANVDDTLRKAFEDLRDKTKEGIVNLKNNSIEQYEEISKNMAMQREAFSSALKAQRDDMAIILQQRQNEFSIYLKEQERVLSDKVSAISTMANEIQAFSDTKKTIEDLVTISTDNKRVLENITDTIISYPAKYPSLAQSVQNTKKVKIDIFSEIIKWGKLVCIVLAVAAFVMYAYDFFTNNIHNSSEVNSSPIIYEDNTKTNIIDSATIIEKDSTNLSNLQNS